MPEPDTQAAIAQLAARRSHNPKVVSSILTGRIYGLPSETQALAAPQRLFTPRTTQRANPDLSQGPADLQSAALTTELLTHLRTNPILLLRKTSARPFAPRVAQKSPKTSVGHMHQPGIEPGSHRWQRCILPLDH